MPDVLFIKTSSLGDVIHHMPALTEAKRNRPDARFAWVVEEQYAPLVALHPLVGEVLPVASRRWRRAPSSPGTWEEIAEFIKRIRASRYDEIIDTQGLFRSALLARLARGRRHGYDVRSIREAPAAWFYDVYHRVEKKLHAIARNRALTALALGYRPQGAPDFGLDRASLAHAAVQPYAVLLHATARREKRREEQSWIAVGRALAARGLDVLLPWGTEEERERGNRIAANISQARVADRQALDQAARVIAGASLVIGVDTGLVHIAAALGVPLVAIFVDSEPGLTGPMGAGPIAIAGGKGAPPGPADVLAALDRVMAAA